jgi:hypothetical protein
LAAGALDLLSRSWSVNLILKRQSEVIVHLLNRSRCKIAYAAAAKDIDKQTEKLKLNYFN